MSLADRPVAVTAPFQARARTLAAALALAAAVLAGCATVPPPGATPEPEPVPGTPLPQAEAPATALPPIAAASAASAADATPAPPVWHGRKRVDLPGDDSRTDLWARVREGMAMPDLDDELVRKWEVHYASQPDYVARMVERGSRYLFHIVEEVDARGLPMELALLPFIESAFNPQAQSSARAAGMWQFMPATGRAFDLRQNAFRDDRRDVIASTRAALDYLEQLNGQFGDWQLALAAYNWGQGSVQRAQRANRLKQRPVDYGSLQMPAETRNYVPKLQAVKNILLRPQDFGLTLPPLDNHPYFLGVAIERDIDVALAARLSGLSLAEFQQFNPQMNRPVILAAGTPQLLLPYDNANRFLRELAQHHGPLASWTAWVAPRTLTPAEAARLVGMSEAALRELNGIPPRMRVRAGSTLLVPRAAHTTQDVGEQLAENAAVLLAPDAPPLRRVVLKAGKNGDTVAGVAKRHGLSAQAVARWNRVGLQARFKPGTRVVVMLPPPKAASKRVARSGGSAAKSRPAPTSRAAKAPAAKSRPTPP